MGKIELDDECSYEQELVEMFVLETKLHGDPVHYGRALGMKAEHFARLGKFSEALEVFDVLAKIYDVDKHSAAICKAYGSDRCAQVFSLSVTWNILLGYERKAREICEFVLDNLIGKMDVKNVHNTLMIIFPRKSTCWYAVCFSVLCNYIFNVLDFTFNNFSDICDEGLG